MTELHVKPEKLRPVYMVLSPRSLHYAKLALTTLLENSEDTLALHLITDSMQDREQLFDVLSGLNHATRHRCSVFAESDLDEAEEERFARYPNLRAFRRGHPCWRKITDPLLLTRPGAEMVLLDPDLYFPNRFRFEETPANGLLLMWQQPNCLLPPEVVRTAMDANIPLARHVDIGVAHWRLSSAMHELEWLDWLIGKLGGTALPRAMHVEAIVWAAIAMKFGGGYLDPERWVCWQRTQARRIRRKLGVSGTSILKAEPWKTLKCFHAGGEAKWWLQEFSQNGLAARDLTASMQEQPLPFVELTPCRYQCEQTAKSMIGNLGYYRLFGAKA